MLLCEGWRYWLRTATQSPPHGYRSAVAYDADFKTWTTVGPNGTNISTDGRNWNALSLPFVVGPHGRIGKLDAEVVKRK